MGAVRGARPAVSDPEASKMDIETIDRSYSQLEAQSQQTIQTLTNLAEKLQAAGQAGDPNAREWVLDLKEIALGIKDEQNQTSALLQAIHDFVVNHLQAQPPQPQYQPPPQYQQVPYQQPAYQGQGGGMLQRFMGGGFGRAIAMGAGFGIGDDIINSIF